MDLDKTWAFIEPILYKILGTENQEDFVAAQEYIDAYTAVYNFCVHRPKKEGFGENAQISAVGSDLYDKLREFLKQYVLSLKKTNEESFLEFYVRKWQRYTIGAGILSNVFNYMDRYWVAKERSDGRRDVFDLNTLSLLAWRTYMFENNVALLIPQILEQVRLHRTNQPYTPALLSVSIKSLATLGFDTQELKKVGLSVYIDRFENIFLEDTAAFYAKESKEYIENHNVVDYIKRAELRIEQEEAFATKYLDEHTKRPLLETVCRELIEAHAPVLYEQFSVLIEKGQIEEIHRMYMLLHKVQTTLPTLAKSFEEFVKKDGLNKIDTLTADPATSTHDQGKKVYIKTLIEVYTNFAEIVKSAFDNDPLFVKALDGACSEFINKNAMATIANSKDSRTPEFLAKYSDVLMKKSNRDNDITNDMSEDDIMIVYRFLDDKDAFETFYRKLLAKRLIHGSYKSFSSEESIISKLTKQSGAQYTSKLTKMFQDMKSSEELKTAFSQYKLKLPNSKKLIDDFTMYVLAETMWPFSPFKHPFELPIELKPTYDALEALYSEKHTGRKLKWIWNLGRAEIKANIGKPGRPPFILSVTLFQLAVILAFNKKDTYSFEELQQITQLPKEYLVGNIAPLIKFKLLSQTPSDPDKIGELETKFTCVKEYRSKRTKVNFATGIKIEQKHDMEETTKEIQQDRHMRLKACIVRIMKARKELGHQSLVSEVIQQTHSRFPAQNSDIKKAIESLIESSYIARLNRDTYQYLA